MAKYIYVPGLARRRFIEEKQPDRGFQKDWDRLQYEDRDTFMYFICNQLMQEIETKATFLDCGKELAWVEYDKNAKAFKLLGSPRENILARKIDLQKKKHPAPKPPRDLQREVQLPPDCITKKWVATPSRHIVAKPALLRLNDGDTLYIVGHGNPRGGELIYKTQAKNACERKDCPASGTPERHWETWSIDPVTLAYLLESEKLKPEIKIKIELLMCFGAGLSLEKEQTVQPYAERLLDAMQGLGFRKIKVSGVKGLILKDRRVEMGLKKKLLKKRLVIPKETSGYDEAIAWYEADEWEEKKE